MVPSLRAGGRRDLVVWRSVERHDDIDKRHVAAVARALGCGAHPGLVATRVVVTGPGGVERHARTEKEDCAHAQGGQDRGM